MSPSSTDGIGNPTRGIGATVSKFVFIYGTKGGVGKSTISVNTAYAMHAAGARAGLVDLDVSGPNVPNLVTGLPGSPPTMSSFRVQPGNYGGVDVSSLGFFVQPHEAPYLTGRYLEGAVEQLLFHDAWNGHDYVVVDLPPGFSELHRQVFSRLKGNVVLVTTPHVLSTQDLSRGKRLLGQISANIYGLVENMSHLECEHCGERSHLFRKRENGSGLDDIPVLARVPFAPEPVSEGSNPIPLVLHHGPGIAEFQTSMRELAHQLMEDR